MANPRLHLPIHLHPLPQPIHLPDLADLLQRLLRPHQCHQQCHQLPFLLDLPLGLLAPMVLLLELPWDILHLRVHRRILMVLLLRCHLPLSRPILMALLRPRRWAEVTPSVPLLHQKLLHHTTHSMLHSSSSSLLLRTLVWEHWLCRINRAIHTPSRFLRSSSKCTLLSSNKCTLLNSKLLLLRQPTRFRCSKVPRHHLRPLLLEAMP
mmetsp:Transcript_21392/g.53021  ORF Transcript_21392/g.53021 Transcript_21392/m.53021 type:complete len:208 (+) Transcript_21392:515-1138(+)